MSTIAQMDSSGVTSAAAYETTQTQKKTKVNGRTIGKPELSEKANEYYEQLKKKYSDMDFILVSKDMKEQAKQQAGNYANANRMVVLIDEEKIERMASDEAYRKQYESVISSARSQLPQLQNSLPANTGVKTYGMQVNDNGTASFFAVIDKSLAAQKDRIAKNAEKKAADKKEADKKANKKKEEKRAEQQKAEKERQGVAESEDTVTITASSIEELIKKINDTVYMQMSDNVQTESEKMVGQSIDYRG